MKNESTVGKTSYVAVRKILGRCTGLLHGRYDYCANFNVAWRRYALYRECRLV